MSIQKTQKKTGHFSIKRFILQLKLLKDIHLANIKTGLMRKMTKFKRLLVKKKRMHKAHQDKISTESKKVAYSNSSKTVQSKPRGMQNLRKKSEEI